MATSKINIISPPQIRTMHYDIIIKVLFIHQLMHKRTVLKNKF